MKASKLIIVVGLMLVLAISIEGVYIFKLQQQINEHEIGASDSSNSAVIEDEWFTRNQNNLYGLFTDFDKMQRQMDQMFGNFSLNSRHSPHFNSVFGDYVSSPALDFIEEDGNYIIEVELPGAKNSSINIKAEDGLLTIQAETSSSRGEDKSTFKRSERYSGKLQRSLSLPPDANADKMTSKLDNGVLTITIPKQT